MTSAALTLLSLDVEEPALRQYAQKCVRDGYALGRLALGGAHEVDGLKLSLNPTLLLIRGSTVDQTLIFVERAQQVPPSAVRDSAFNAIFGCVSDATFADAVAAFMRSVTASIT